jgi:hypothetical protein
MAAERADGPPPEEAHVLFDILVVPTDINANASHYRYS